MGPDIILPVLLILPTMMFLKVAIDKVRVVISDRCSIADIGLTQAVADCNPLKSTDLERWQLVETDWKSLLDRKYSQQSSFDDKTANVRTMLAMPSNPRGIVFNLD
ncbi:MAG: hypothetical protein ACLFWI_06925 [Coleofasciculus sp.]